MFKSIKKCVSTRCYNSTQFYFLFCQCFKLWVLSLELASTTINKFIRCSCHYLIFCIANGRRAKKTPYQHFDPPSLNRLELTETLWWLFLNMTGLQDGENRTSLASIRYIHPSGYSGSKLEVVNTTCERRVTCSIYYFNALCKGERWSIECF